MLTTRTAKSLIEQCCTVRLRNSDCFSLLSKVIECNIDTRDNLKMKTIKDQYDYLHENMTYIEINI